MKTPVTDALRETHRELCRTHLTRSNAIEIMGVSYEVMAKHAEATESSRNELLAALEIAEKYVAAAKVRADTAFLNDTGSAAAVAKAGGDLISVRAVIANARKLAVNSQHSSQIVTQNQIDVRDKGKEGA